jgi:hypothetical protein
MNRFCRVAIAAVALLGAASIAMAEAPSRVLNKLEVQKLVAAETPIANLRLAIHFNGVAEQYFHDAAHHRATAVVYGANAHRSIAATVDDHCERQAAVAIEWGVAARRLARYHTDLATGRTAVFPKGAAELQGGRGAPEPTAEQLHRLALTARTRSDHLALQEYYATVAGERATAAEDYGRMAAAYRAGIHRRAYDLASNYDRLARLARRAAKQATEAANRHRQLATIA